MKSERRSSRGCCVIATREEEKRCEERGAELLSQSILQVLTRVWAPACHTPGCCSSCGTCPCLGPHRCSGRQPHPLLPGWDHVRDVQDVLPSACSILFHVQGQGRQGFCHPGTSLCYCPLPYSFPPLCLVPHQHFPSLFPALFNTCLSTYCNCFSCCPSAALMTFISLLELPPPFSPSPFSSSNSQCIFASHRCPAEQGRNCSDGPASHRPTRCFLPCHAPCSDHLLDALLEPHTTSICTDSVGLRAGRRLVVAWLLPRHPECHQQGSRLFHPLSPSISSSLICPLSLCGSSAPCDPPAAPVTAVSLPCRSWLWQL